MTPIEKALKFCDEETARVMEMLRQVEDPMEAEMNRAVIRAPKSASAMFIPFEPFGEKSLRFAEEETKRVLRSQQPPLSEMLAELQSSEGSTDATQLLGRLQSLYPEFFPPRNTPLLETLPSHRLSQHFEGSLEATSASIPVFPTEIEALALPASPEITWKDFYGFDGNLGPKGSYVVSFSGTSGVSSLQDFPIALNNARYAAVDAQGNLFVVHRDTAVDSIHLRGFKSNGDYATEEWCWLVQHSGDGAEPSYGAPVIAVFSKASGNHRNEQLVIAVPVNKDRLFAGSSTILRLYQHPRPQRLFSFCSSTSPGATPGLSGDVATIGASSSVKWIDIDLDPSQETEVGAPSVVYDEEGNIHIVFEWSSTLNGATVKAIYYGFLAVGKDFTALAADNAGDGWEIVKVTEFSTYQTELDDSALEEAGRTVPPLYWREDKLPTLAVREGRGVIAWKRAYNNAAGDELKRTDVVFRVLLSLSPISLGEPQYLCNLKDVSAWVDPEPQESSSRTPTFYLASETGAEKPTRWVQLNFAQTVSASTLANTLVKNVKCFQAEGALNSDFVAGAAGGGYWVAVWECQNTDPHKLVQVWGVAAAVGEKDITQWSSLTDMASQVGRPEPFYQGTYPSTFLTNVASTASSYTLFTSPGDPSMDLSCHVVIERGPIPSPNPVALRGRYLPSAVSYTSNSEGSTWMALEEIRYVSEASPLQNLLKQTRCKVYRQMTFAGFPMVLLQPFRSVLRVHLFWWESRIPDAQGIGLDINASAPFSLRHKCGTLSS